MHICRINDITIQPCTGSSRVLQVPRDITGC